MITATDDGILRTHDDALSYLQSHATGAIVRSYRVPNETEKCRRYTISLDRVGRAPIHETATYGLPCVAAHLRDHVQRMLNKDSPWLK